MRPSPVVLSLTLLAACSNPAPDVDGGADASVSDAGMDAPAPDAYANTGLPDLTVDATELQNNLQFARMYFPAGACEIAEGCVAAPGWRSLLLFTTFTPNVGTADLVFGPNVYPDGGINGDFEYSSCHMHYHFRGYADYSLLAADGSTAAIGHKQSFCVEDLVQVSAGPGIPSEGVYGNCGDMGGQQGISRGWADDYYPNLPCQWIDVTDVAPGNYMLQVELNTMHHIEELDYANDIATVPVVIPADTSVGDSTRDCTATDPDQGIGRNCGWQRERLHTCTPGQSISVGCNAACGVGSCNDADGGYDIRICRGDHNCNGDDAAAVIASDFGECGSGVFNLDSVCGVARFMCPAEGQYTVLVSNDYTCQGDGDCALTGETCVNGRCVDGTGNGYSGCHIQTVVAGASDSGVSDSDAGVDAAH